ncbi:hypothetical protein SAMN02982929_05327 [Saccharopolyspora kobensis]|uniref:Uncharacterized protein n=1 Tax=Saccharopolyspora kobensis TaxID=146035 RepID=A0A1H6DZV0_9PSEU|nr:hypothetical protein [Saccharopolyspora kobensis]SEG90860.1 hypothetical protein SAMN02982929_05327 [Saccharopolyspora kobensis]SFD94288.1 hypothetical protein SAMN05216506_107303 [Saccharopolyspora kobensis]
MELTGFAPRENSTGDRLPAKEAVDKPLIVQVREHRTGVKTKFNSNPNEKGYKPDGGEAVVLDVADLTTNSVFVDVLWMNGAVVDNLKAYVGQAIPIKLVWTGSASGGNSYITVEALGGAELDKAAAWAQANPDRFDTERAQRAAAGADQPQPAVPATPPATVAQQQPQAAPVPPQPAMPQQAINPNDPAVQALLQQISGGQTPPAA